MGDRFGKRHLDNFLPKSKTDCIIRENLSMVITIHNQHALRSFHFDPARTGSGHLGDNDDTLLQPHGCAGFERRLCPRATFSGIGANRAWEPRFGLEAPLSSKPEEAPRAAQLEPSRAMACLLAEQHSSLLHLISASWKKLGSSLSK